MKQICHFLDLLKGNLCNAESVLERCVDCKLDISVQCEIAVNKATDIAKCLCKNIAF